MVLRKALVSAAILAWASAVSAAPIQLITNGDFEAGSLTGWTVSNLAGGSGDWYFDVPGTSTPFSGLSTLASSANGLGYAVSDQGGPGTHALIQAFTLGPSVSVVLRFDIFVNDWDGGPLYGGQGLNHIGPANQFGRVDILSSGATAFDTGVGVLANYFLGVDAGADPHAFTSYLFDVTSVVGAGGTFALRFAETDNQSFFNLGVDNVSILAEPVPEPSTLLLLGGGLVGLARLRRRK